MKQNIHNIIINTANSFAFVAIWFAVITSWWSGDFNNIFKSFGPKSKAFFIGRVAQLVEHGTENPGVSGSIPLPATIGL